MNGCVLETQRGISAVFISDHDPVQGEVTGQHVTKSNSEALQFVGLSLGEDLVINKPLQDRQVLPCLRQADGSVSSLGGGRDDRSLLVEAHDVLRREFGK